MSASDITLGEIERRLASIEKRLDDRTYVQTEVFHQYQALILEQNKAQGDRLTKLEAWQTSVYALLGTAYLGIIGAVIVSFVR